MIDNNERWRGPAQVVAFSEAASDIPRDAFKYRTRGDWWGLLDRLEITVFLTREYEHFLLALSVDDAPKVTYLALPHPNGLAVRPDGEGLMVASTRNPNQVFELTAWNEEDRTFMPRRTTFYPGSLYVHDVAYVGGVLHANAVGRNAVVRLDLGGSHENVWWPNVIDGSGRPHFDVNHLQLNSIAAGPTLEDSFFSASTDELATKIRIGDPQFPVDRRGVIFSGRTRDAVCRGLTRPHSARLKDGELWVLNSGYGEFGRVSDGTFEPVATLRGWTRGLAFRDGIAFVGTSHVLPRFEGYAPGLDPSTSACAVHAVELRSGREIASIVWPHGDQIFAIEVVPRATTPGLPFNVTRRAPDNERRLFFDDPMSTR